MINYYEMIMKTMGGSKVPLPVRADILNRCFDWFQSGGHEEDEYIKTQYNYLVKVIEYTRK